MPAPATHHEYFQGRCHLDVHQHPNKIHPMPHQWPPLLPYTPVLQCTHKIRDLGNNNCHAEQHLHIWIHPLAPSVRHIHVNISGYALCQNLLWDQWIFNTRNLWHPPDPLTPINLQHPQTLDKHPWDGRQRSLVCFQVSMNNYHGLTWEFRERCISIKCMYLQLSIRGKKLSQKFLRRN